MLDKSTTTSSMAQPQCSKKQCINVNMASGAVQIHSTLDRAVRSVSRFQQHEVEVETVATIREGGDRQTFLGVSNADQSGEVVQGCVPRRSTVSVQAGDQHEQ